MKYRFRIALASATMAAGLALAGASPAQAQVRFSGSFPLPHGRISIGIGDPFFRVGAVVPFGYAVIQDPSYGYGFYYRSRWIPVERYGSSWIVCNRPVFSEGGYVDGGHRYDGFARYPDAARFDGRIVRRFDRDDRRFVRSDRRFDRDDRARRFERDVRTRRDERGGGSRSGRLHGGSRERDRGR